MSWKEYRSLVPVMIGLALVTLTGFMRQSAIAYVLGVERAADIYLVAFALPEFIFIALPIILTPVIIPLFSQLRQKNGERFAWQWGRQLSGWILLLLLGIMIVAALAAPLVIQALSPGFNDLERAQAVDTLYRMLPGLLLMGASVLVGSFLQVYRKFARPVFTTAIYNLAFIASLLFLPVSDPLYRAGWGVTLGAVAALVFQLPILFSIKPDNLASETAPEIDRKVLAEAKRLTGWMAAGYGIHHLILFIDRAMATSLAVGSAAVLNYGYHLALSASQLGALAVSIVFFPSLSEQVGAERLSEARRSVSNAFEFAWILTLPAILGMILLCTPLVQVLFEHGIFPAEATDKVSNVLVIYAVAVLADALCQPLWRVIYAQKNGKAVVQVNSIQTAVRIGLNILLVSRLGYNGIAISAMIGLSLQLSILMIRTHKSLELNPSRGYLTTLGKILIAGLLAYVITLLVQALVARSIVSIPPIAELIAYMTIFLGIDAILVIWVFRIFQFNKDFMDGKQQIDLL